MQEIGFDPWIGKIPWRRKWQPTPAWLPGEFLGQRSLVGYSPWGHNDLERTESKHTHTHTHTHTQTLSNYLKNDEFTQVGTWTIFIPPHLLVLHSCQFLGFQAAPFLKLEDRVRGHFTPQVTPLFLSAAASLITHAVSESTLLSEATRTCLHTCSITSDSL